MSIRIDGEDHAASPTVVELIHALRAKLAEREKEVERLRYDYCIHEQNYMSVVARVKGSPCGNDYMHPTDAAVILEGYINKARKRAEAAEAEVKRLREALGRAGPWISAALSDPKMGGMCEECRGAFEGLLSASPDPLEEKGGGA